MGMIMTVLGCLLFLAAVVEYVRVQSVEEHCPPRATCDAKGLLSFLAIMFGGGGLVAAAVGGVLVLATRAGGKGSPSG
jgi:hypothetical protein